LGPLRPCSSLSPWSSHDPATPDSAAGVETPPSLFRSLGELARRYETLDLPASKSIYEVERIHALPLILSDFGRQEALSTFQAPLHLIEHQTLVMTRDTALGTEAIVNPLRSSRVPMTATANIPPPPSPGACRWCNTTGWGGTGHSAESIGEYFDASTGVIVRGNWARQAPISAVVHGPQHDLAALVESFKEFVSLFAAADQYIERAPFALPPMRSSWSSSTGA